MLKIVQSSNEALKLVHELAELPELSDFRVGVTGSFMQGTNKKSSPLDLVLKLKDDGDKDLIGSIFLLMVIKKYLERVIHNKYNIIWLDLLEKDEVSLHDLMPREGVETNPESAYTNMVELVKFADEEFGDADDEDEEDIDEDEDDEEGDN